MVVAVLDQLREVAEKVRSVTWVNEPVATLEDAVVHLAQTRAMVEAAECEALAAFETSKEWKAAGAGSAAARVAHVTGARKNTVGRRCHLGGRLRAMPHTEAAFAAGEITLDHVDALARVNVPTLAVRFAVDEERMVGWARELPYREFFAKVADWRDVVAPDDAEERAQSQVESRGLFASETFGGMGRLDAWLDPLSYREFADELERHERRLFEQDWADARERLGDAATKADLARTPAQRRADALVEMARAAKAHAGLGAEPTLGTTIVCDDDTFLTCLARLFADDTNGQPLCKRDNRFKERLAAYRRRREPGRPTQP